MAPLFDINDCPTSTVSNMLGGQTCLICYQIMQDNSPEQRKKKEKGSKLQGLQEVKHHVKKHGNKSSERML
jgi:hypothetical protein